MYVLLLAWSLSGPAVAAEPAAAQTMVVVSSDTLTRYDALRAALVEDKYDVVASLAADFTAASIADPALAAAAGAVATAADAAHQRTAFGELSKLLLLRLAASSSPPKVWAYFCPMWSGFGWWIQTQPGISNPYMGTSMPRCGSEVSWRAAARAAAAPAP